MRDNEESTLLSEHQEPFTALAFWDIEMCGLYPAKQGYSLR